MLGVIVVIIIIGGFGVILAPLIAIILFFGGGGGGGGGSAPDADTVASVFEGDGKGELDPTTVPEGMSGPIQDAGKLCPDIGPVVIAAQIEQESGFNADKVGPNGEQGISQLPPEVFARLGKDDDGNRQVSALDPTDSILAQGRYLCELVEEVRPRAVPGQPMQDVLSLALAAYDVGVGAVREANGVPQTNESQQYVLGIRAQFATYQGIVPPLPSTSPSQTDSDG
jgi:hypothetical protein